MVFGRARCLRQRSGYAQLANARPRFAGLRRKRRPATIPHAKQPLMPKKFVGRLVFKHPLMPKHIIRTGFDEVAADAETNHQATPASCFGSLRRATRI